jgi:acyl-CoA reductase-like NAD-dependent aldehyde dehydrogenase
MPDTTTSETTAAVNGTAATARNGAGRERIEVENPATGGVAGSVPRMLPEDVAPLVERARAVQPGWWEIGFDGRAQVLRRAQRWVLDNADRVIDTIVSETGKTRDDAQLAEVGYAAGAFGFWAKNAERYLRDRKLRASSPMLLGRQLRIRYGPRGVVGVIGPWNYPLVNSFGDAIPALAAGNAVILKPSEVTPLTSLLMAECLAECGAPDGVFQVLTGLGDVGAELIDHVDFIMFTGSTATGRKVAERAAKTLTPFGLELGGKDPMIVLRDADLEKAANAATYYSMQNGGQTCISVERVYVEEPAYDEFVKRVTDKVARLRQGAPQAAGSVDVGAVTFDRQAEIVESHVEDARAKGAQVVVGGKRGEGPGRFFEPTVLLDVDHSMACMTEETFGPTLPIMKVRDADEAVRLANDSQYGLQASVWTRDAARGEEIAKRIEAGVANVNEHLLSYVALELPMGGWKQSGIGTRHGEDGIRKYARQQASVISRFGMKREIFMFPYSKRSAGLLRRVLKLIYGRGRR